MRAEARTQPLVTEILQSKGYVLADHPDLTVRIAAGLREKHVPFPLAAPPPGGPNDAWFKKNLAAEILEGSLVIDVYETASGTLLWHGGARAALDPEHFDEDRLRRAVVQVMSSFPERR
jgi:hypothetical protein